MTEVRSPVPLPPQDEDVVVLERCAQCGTLAQPGRFLCDAHWGEQQVSASRARLLAAAPQAVETLVQVAAEGHDAERVRAANSILDRAGLRGAVDVNLRAGAVGLDPAKALRERLAQLRRDEPATRPCLPET